MQWGTNGHIPVKAHDRQEKAVGTSPRSREKHLGSTSHKGDSLSPHNQAREHPRDDSQCVTGLREGQEGKEEIHGCVQMAIQPDHYDDEDIASDGDEIQREEQDKQQKLKLPKAREAQEDKVPPAGGIVLCHWE